jgi:hypothetical protein
MGPAEHVCCAWLRRQCSHCATAEQLLLARRCLTAAQLYSYCCCDAHICLLWAAVALTCEQSHPHARLAYITTAVHDVHSRRNASSLTHIFLQVSIPPSCQPHRLCQNPEDAQHCPSYIRVCKIEPLAILQHHNKQHTSSQCSQANPQLRHGRRRCATIGVILLHPLAQWSTQACLCVLQCQLLQRCHFCACSPHASTAGLPLLQSGIQGTLCWPGAITASPCRRSTSMLSVP